MKQVLLTPAAGKRLIAKGLLAHHAIQQALGSHTLVVIAGTTNGYVAEELLAHLGQQEGFSRDHFIRGITLPPGMPRPASGRSPDAAAFPGDVVIAAGVWQKGRTILDVVGALGAGDVILKGANALDLERREAAVYIGHPEAGTIGAALHAAAGRRARLLFPVGIEKRVPGNLMALATALNSPDASGPRLLPAPGEVFTEIDAIRLLTGAEAVPVAAGGVGGAEGAVWLLLRGSVEQIDAAVALAQSVAAEPPFTA